MMLANSEPKRQVQYLIHTYATYNGHDPSADIIVEITCLYHGRCNPPMLEASLLH
jgi:hypothetical protein